MSSKQILTLLALGLALVGCGAEPAPRQQQPVSIVTPPTSSASPWSPPPPVGAGALLDTLELAGGEAALTRNVYFIIDGSGSMKDQPGKGCSGDQRFKSKLEGAQWAVRTFLEKVPDDVNIGLFVFDRRGSQEQVPLGTGNRDEFLLAVERIAAGGGTPLADSMRLATDQLVGQYQRQLGYGEFRLVAVTDGRADAIPEAAGYAESWGMPIYAIGLCIDEDHPLRQHALSYRAADNFDDLAEGLEQTLAELPSFDATEFESE
jgi:hypothetical protein